MSSEPVEPSSGGTWFKGGVPVDTITSTTTTTTHLGAAASEAMRRRMEKAGGFTAWKADLYAAEDWRQGLEVIFRVVPYWVPVATAVVAGGVYYGVFRARLFLNKWRKAVRLRAERKYDLLDNLRDMSAAPPVGAVEALQDDDDDEDEDDEDDEDNVDETAVGTRDVEEFRSSLGIRLPRDEDLLSIVERILLVDPIPDGWVLYRTSAGIIRFMNLNTQELFFFPPNKKKEKQFIESELRHRNRQAMESKYSFSYEDESMNSHTLSKGPGDEGGAGASSSATGKRDPSGSTTNPLDGGSNPDTLSKSDRTTFDFEEASVPEEDETENSTFKRMFNFFLEKEQRRIDEDVARSRINRDTTGGVTPRQHLQGGSSSHESSLNYGSHADGGTTTATNTATTLNGQAVNHYVGDVSAGNSPAAVRGGGAAGRSVSGRSASMSYRVVSSSAIHGGRGNL